MNSLRNGNFPGVCERGKGGAEAAQVQRRPRGVQEEAVRDDPAEVGRPRPTRLQLGHGPLPDAVPQGEDDQDQ